MDNIQKRNFLVLLVISLMFFVIFIFPNSTGSFDVNMLSIFEVDEYAQYSHVIRMLQPGETLYQTIRNFLIYLHYFYGYPFYFFSAVVIFPLKLIFGSGWEEHTRVIVAVLRQMISVFPMMISIFFWIYIFTEFRNRLKTVIGFLLLLLIPAVFENNFWWHPDSLAFLFVTLSFYCFYKDKLTYKTYFWAAAVMTGLALGTKHLGEFFVFAVPVYLIFGWVRKKIKVGKASLYAVGFVVVMAAAVVLSNPLLLLPMERAEIISTQVRLWGETTIGSVVTHSGLGFDQQSFLFLFMTSGGLLFIPVSIYALFDGIRKNNNRLLLLLITAWLIPYGVVVFFGSSLRPHYLIPFYVPLFSTVIMMLPEKIGEIKKQSGSLILAFLIIFQIGCSLFLDYRLWSDIYQREEKSQSIAFYNHFQQEILPDLDQPPQVIFRDWEVYFPEDSPWQVVVDWDDATYETIMDLQPDLIFLNSERIELFSGEAGREFVNPEVRNQQQVFYSDAAVNQINGYELLYESDFAKIFIFVQP